MKKTGIVSTLSMALFGAALFLPWQACAENAISPQPPRSTTRTATSDAATKRVETPDFLAILQTVDQLEGQMPTRSDLITTLRGQLFRYERQTQREKFDLIAQVRKSQANSAKTPVEPGRRPGSNWQREPEPGSNLYTPCQGLSDKALVDKLREISAYQVGLDYREARQQMFTKIDNVAGEVECVYTGRKGRYNSLPSDRDMNCEHTWPQSHGAVGIAKSDLHHLFPTDSSANSTRGSLPFGQVSNAEWAEGGSKCDGDVFEIRPEHRGNAARAKFYFAVRYGKQIGAEEEATLREWNKEDPIDAAEKARNDKIENLQHNRNPFIDHPEFIDRISDF